VSRKCGPLEQVNLLFEKDHRSEVMHEHVEEEKGPGC
jgi:hypothetical protein